MNADHVFMRVSMHPAASTRYASCIPRHGGTGHCKNRGTESCQCDTSQVMRVETWRYWSQYPEDSFNRPDKDGALKRILSFPACAGYIRCVISERKVALDCRIYGRVIGG